MGRWTLVIGAAAACLMVSDAQAARLFLSTHGIGQLVPGDVGAVPSINATAGGEYDLHVWIVPDADQQYIGAGYGIATNNATAVTAVAASNMVDNPVNTGNSLTRWGSTNPGVLNNVVDVDPSPTVTTNENFLVHDTRGGVIVIGTNAGIGSLPIHATDPNRDAASGAFHLGSVRVRAADATGTVGLYLRQGATGVMNIRNAAGTVITTTVPLFFGDTPTSPVNGGTAGRNRGDALNPNNVGADALLVFGGGPAREIIQFTADPNNTGQVCNFGPPSNVQPANCVINPASTEFRVNALGVQHDFFDVFFDLNEDDPADLQAIVTTLTTQESDEGLEIARVIANGENTLGLGIDFDVHLRYNNTAGGNRLLDVDFSSVPGVMVNNVAIPEPSTWALVACGLLGLAMARRRK